MIPGKMLLAIALLGCICLPGQAALHLEAGDLPGPQSTLGEAAAKGVVVEDAGLTVPLVLPPGRYRVDAVVRSNRKGTVLRQRLFTMTAAGQSVSQPVEDLDRGLNLVMTLVHAGGTLNLAFAPSSRLTAAMQTEMHVLAARDLGDPSDRMQAPGEGLGGEGLVDDLLGELMQEGQVLDLSRRGIPMQQLESLRVTPLSGPVIAESVSTDRITYAPGGSGRVHIRLRNLAKTPEKAEWVLVMTEGISSATPLGNGRISLGAGEQAEREVPFQVGDALWGRGLRLEVVSGKDVTDVAAHAVSVVDNPWMVAMHGRGTPMFGSELWSREQAHEEARRLAQANMDAYANVYEAFAWAACDYSDMTPAHDEPFYSGQTQYAKKRSSLQILHEVFEAHGIPAITYGKACGGGYAGLQFSHAHPQLMNIFGHAGFAHESMDVDVIDRMREGRYRHHGRDEDFWQMWISCWTHFGNHETTFYGSDEIARSARLLGWDGVRYDGAWEVWGDPAGTARLLAATEKHIADQVPGFVFGYNHGGPQHNKREGALADVVLAAMARGGGQVMSEFYRGLHGAVEVNIRHLQNMGDAVRTHGGYFLCIFDDGTAWNTALVMAAGGRPMGGHDQHTLRKFATRFSQFMFDPALRRLENPGAIIKPVGEIGFRWDAFVYERAVSATEAQLILQLVNVSDDTAFGDQYTQPVNLNPPQRDLAFDVTLPDGYRIAGVFATEDHDTFAPMPVRLEGNRLHIPEVRLWSLVVLELESTPGAHAGRLQHELARPEPGRAGEAFTDEDIQAINAGRVRITPEVLDQVLALGLPKDTAPGDELFNGVAFDGHRGGRDAGWDAAPVEALPPVRTGRPDILHARGPFSHRHRLEEGFAGIEGADVREASMRNISGLADLAAGNPGCMQPWPDRAGLARHDVVVLDAVPAPALSLQQRRDLRDFVKGGGGLFVIGGWYSLSKGQYEGSFIEEALPVRTRQATYLRRVRPEDGVLQATDAYARVLGAEPPDFGKLPTVEWLSHIEPRPGSEVLVTTANGLPVLVTGGYGEGRTLVWAASNSGQPGAPWWESAWWPGVARAGLRYLLAGAETVAPPDAGMAARLAAARMLLEDAELDILLEDASDARTANTQGAADALDLLLRHGGGGNAHVVAAWLLDHAAKVDPKRYADLTGQILPHLAGTPEWAAVARRHVANPPHMLADLVVEIAVASLPGIPLERIMRWRDIDERTRLRALAVLGDPAARPELARRHRALDQQEAEWHALRWEQGGMPVDIYRTRLLRPFVTWALLQCGQDDDETSYAFARACLELPYYHWRQHWVLANRHAGMIEAQRAGGTGTEQQSAVRACEGAIREMARAMEQVRPWFTPERIGTTPEARRAVARALAEADSRKALPLALAYVRATPREHLADLAALEHARLDSLRHLYAARKAAAVER